MVAPAVDVTDVLRDRRAEPTGLRQTAMVSAAVHGVLLVAMVVFPRAWLSRFEPPPRTVMTISLGDGAPGPSSGGFSSIGGRAVQQEAPPPDAPKRQGPESHARPAHAGHDRAVAAE